MAQFNDNWWGYINLADYVYLAHTLFLSEWLMSCVFSIMNGLFKVQPPCVLLKQNKTNLIDLHFICQAECWMELLLQNY